MPKMVMLMVCMDNGNAKISQVPRSADPPYFQVSRGTRQCQNWRVHLLPLPLVEGAEEAGDEHVELPDLLLVVVLQRILVPLLQTGKRGTHLKIFSV